MNDLNEFFKKHDVKLETPPGEWQAIRSRIERRSWFSLPLVSATAGALALALTLVISLPKQSAPLSDEEALDYISTSFAYIDEGDIFDE